MSSGFNSTPRLKAKQSIPAPTSAPPEPIEQPAPKRAKFVRVDEVDRPGQAPKGTLPHWRVWNVQKAWMPRFRHSTEESARNEAVRLSIAFVGVTFYVVRVEAAITTPE